MPDQPIKKTKRQVKNPETFRERALKAAESSDKPERAKPLRRTTRKVVGTTLGPIAKPIGKVFALKPFKLIGKVIFPVYFRRSWRELRLVTWPAAKESRRLTFAVLIFAVVFGAAVAAVDYGLDRAFRHILLK